MVADPPPAPTAIATDTDDLPDVAADIADGLHQLAALVRAHPELADTLRLRLAHIPAICDPEQVPTITAAAVALGATIGGHTLLPNPWIPDSPPPEVLRFGRGAVRVLLHPNPPTQTVAATTPGPGPAGVAYVPDRVTSWR